MITESVKRNSITSDTFCVEIKGIQRSWMISLLRPLEQLDKGEDQEISLQIKDSKEA